VTSINDMDIKELGRMVHDLLGDRFTELKTQCRLSAEELQRANDDWVVEINTSNVKAALRTGNVVWVKYEGGWVSYTIIRDSRQWAQNTNCSDLEEVFETTAQVLHQLEVSENLARWCKDNKYQAAP
tara:strand:+ start:26929 stop:27309 length:381 start_codon:yes stop_codon:yes gene_type:complete